MKKLKILLCTLLAAGGLMASAEPFTVHVKVDDASHVKAYKYVGYSKVEYPLVTGDNAIELDAPNYFTFAGVEPYAISKVYNVDLNDEEYIYEGKWEPQFSSEGSYEITTANADDARTASFTVNVDDPSKVEFQRRYQTPTVLQAGPNVIKFNPETETAYSVSAVYGSTIYKVEVDSRVITPSYGTYDFTVSDNSVVNILTVFPDEDATITFKYKSGSEGCIDDVRVANKPVTDFDGKTLKVRLGQNLSFGVAKNWRVISYSLNGESSSYFYSYTGVVTGDMEFEFLAEYNDPTVSFNVNVDDASHLKATNSSTGAVYSLTDGDNLIKIDRYQSIEFVGVEPYVIKEVINLDTNNPESIYNGRWSKYVNDNNNHYKITTYNLDATRTASATFKVDDASKVTIHRESDYAIIPIENGDNIIKFNPETESRFLISPKTATPLWEVKMDGQSVASSRDSYYVTLTNGCTVDITATIPDIDITATFVMNDDAKGCISKVKVEGKEIDFNGTEVKMKAGQSIDLTFSPLYKIDNFKIGETTEYIYGTSYNKLLMADTTFTIEAHKYATIKTTITVDDPSNVVIGNGSSMYYDPAILTLHAGENVVELPENNTSICWQATPGGEIVSVELNGEPAGSTYSPTVEMKEGDELVFTTSKIVYDLKAMVWIDNKEAASNYFNLSGGNSADRSSLDVATGYSEIAFRTQMLPLALSWYGSEATVGKVHINGKLVEPQYAGATTYELPIKDGDVVKIFLATEPVEHVVTFDVEEDIVVEATTDRITLVEKLTEPLTVFAGTEVAFTAESDEKLVVKNGETELTPGEDGKYVVTVDGETALSVKKFQKGDFAVALDKSDLTLVEEDAATLTATITKGDDVTVEAQEFTSSDAAVATVSAEGVVTAYAPGMATITFTATDNYGRTASATCEVTVTEKSGIAEIEAANGSATIYDMQGRRVNKTGRGLYIVNGRKVRL